MTFQSPRDHQTGVATVLVLWMVSALMVLAAALALSVRSQAHMVSLEAQVVNAYALGEAATNLALKDILTAGDAFANLQRPFEKTYPIYGHLVSVTVTPANGFINLNSADQDLLTRMFVYGALLPEDEASILAQRVIDWRDEDSTPLPLGAEDEQYASQGNALGARDGFFIVNEDIRQVLGVSVQMYSALKEMFTVYGSESSLNVNLSPPKVLEAFFSGDMEQVSNVLGARGVNNATASQSGGQVLGGNSVSSSVLLEARVTGADGSLSRYARWVDIALPAPNGLPWTTLRVEPISHKLMSEVGSL